MPATTQKNGTEKSLTVTHMFEKCVGCKWTLLVMTQIRAGVSRPGALLRSADGLTAKVLQQRLKKLTAFGILSRKAFPTIPPHVEYSLTPFGARFLEILDQIEVLNRDRCQGWEDGKGQEGERKTGHN